MAEGTFPLPSVRRRLAWSAVVAVLSVAVPVGLAWKGHAARAFFLPPPDFQGQRWAVVADAGAAYRAWEAAGVYGRRLLVLTGRWSKPRDIRDRPPTPAELTAEPGAPYEIVDVDSALFAAAQVGIARRIDVVFPPAFLALRAAQLEGRKEFVRDGPGAFLQRFDALERRFSRPDAFVASSEPMLVLVEPSFFQDGTPADPAAWLSERGASVDLALIAADDPSATDVQRAAVRDFAQGIGALFVEPAR